MEADIIEGLRVKEEEMSALIEEARAKAAAIRDQASRQAKELKAAKMAEAESLVREALIKEESLIASEASSIEKRHEDLASEVRLKGSSRMEEAVKVVFDTVIGR